MHTFKNMQIAQKHLEGKTQEQIAEELQISQSTASRRLNRAETKEYIDKIQQECVQDGLQIAKHNFVNLIKNYETCDRKDFISREHGFKASVKLLESYGVVSGSSPSVYFMSIHQSHTSIISPVIMQALGISGSDQDDNQVPIDAEFYETTTT